MTNEIMPVYTDPIDENAEFETLAATIAKKRREADELIAAARQAAQQAERKRRRKIRRRMREAWLFLCGVLTCCCGGLAVIVYFRYPPFLAVCPAVCALLSLGELFRRRCR